MPDGGTPTPVGRPRNAAEGRWLDVFWLPDGFFSGLLFTKGHKALFHSLQKERMMKKTGAGWFVFVAGALLLGGGALGVGGGGEAMGQEPTASASADPSAVQSAEPDGNSEAPLVSAKAKAAARLNEINGLPINELKDKLAATEAALPALNVKLADAGRAAQDARATAAENSQEIKDLYVQIRALHDRIAALTETLPEVQAKVAEQTAIRGELLSEMDFRTKLTGLIRQREAAEAATANSEELP